MNDEDGYLRSAERHQPYDVGDHGRRRRCLVRVDDALTDKERCDLLLRAAEHLKPALNQMLDDQFKMTKFQHELMADCLENEVTGSESQRYAAAHPQEATGASPSK